MVKESITIQRENAPLRVTAAVKTQFTSIANWAFILSIISFIVIGAVITAALVSMYHMGIIRNTSSSSPLFIGAGYLIACVLALIPVNALFQFSQHLKTAIKDEDQGTMKNAFDQLKTGLTYSGVAVVVLLAFGLLGSFLG